jgi:hypothetical protein
VDLEATKALGLIEKFAATIAVVAEAVNKFV